MLQLFHEIREKEEEKQKLDKYVLLQPAFFFTPLILFGTDKLMCSDAISVTMRTAILGMWPQAM
jgi:hypothetical protein